jgi:hypothetical protein
MWMGDAKYDDVLSYTEKINYLPSTKFSLYEIIDFFIFKQIKMFRRVKTAHPCP